EADKANWVSDGVIKPKGDVLKLSSSRALELGVARYQVPAPELAAVFPQYGLDAASVKDVTPGWLDRLSEFLRRPTVTILLMIVGFAGLVLELKAPGLTFPGITAAICFILLFWAHTAVNGNSAILGGMIFLLGLTLVLLEIFVIPGFGVPGILGVLFMLGGIGVATFEQVPTSTEEWVDFGLRIASYFVAMIGATILAFFVARYLPNIPYANKMMLGGPEESGENGLNDMPGVAAAAALLGAIGTAMTTLRPAGMAQFGEQYLDVVTDGGYISAGTRVRVIEVEGTRIVVKEV
ncbi:MAG: NfeD family protein, partial [Gemmataceae bacterium]